MVLFQSIHEADGLTLGGGREAKTVCVWGGGFYSMVIFEAYIRTFVVLAKVTIATLKMQNTQNHSNMRSCRAVSQGSVIKNASHTNPVVAEILISH